MLTEIADKIFKNKYARILPNGKLEEWGQCASRVGEYIARGETVESNYLQYTADFTKLILDQVFIPGGRILANSGTGIKNLFNCFTLPIEDSRQGIYSTLSKAAEIFSAGGGIGYNFSNLREKGALVQTTGGKASGPVSFMELFNTTGDVIAQASRRGAQIGILNCNHPDIVEFICCKNLLSSKNRDIYNTYSELTDNYTDVLEKILKENQLNHFNISVGIFDFFMDAVTHNTPYNLVYRDGVIRTISATDILYLVARAAWESGDPGLFFIDTANRNNIAPYLGKIECTNPCGEVTLLPNEACCLGSINLTKFVEKDYIDLPYLRDVVRYAVRFLDNTHTLNYSPIADVDIATKNTRRLGLGIMGFADILAEMGIQYDSEDALKVIDTIGGEIQKTAWETSMNLANEKGSFPGFIYDKTNWTPVDKLNLERRALRNVAITSIAPTGTLALLCGVNSGIEPFFSKKYIRNVTSGIKNKTDESIITDINLDVKTAHEIHWKDHINVQAKWQEYTDNGISKTINMSNDSSVEDVYNAFVYAWSKGCKGITIYRDQSRGFQILNPV